MRKISYREAWKREDRLCKYALPAIGALCIILALVTPVEDTFVLWFLGGMFLFLSFWRPLSTSNSMVECPGREDKVCKKLINRWEEYCKYCGRKNDLVS